MIKKAEQTAQNIQDKIFRKMTASKKIRLAAELSALCLKLNQLGKDYGVRKAPTKISRNIS